MQTQQTEDRITTRAYELFQKAQQAYFAKPAKDRGKPPIWAEHYQAAQSELSGSVKSVSSVKPAPTQPAPATKSQSGSDTEPKAQ